MWGFYDAYTAAQIELMAADCPVTDYGHSTGNGKKKEENPDVDGEDVREKADRWREKYKGTDGSVHLDLDGFNINRV